MRYNETEGNQKLVVIGDQFTQFGQRKTFRGMTFKYEI